jgi:hypothetical protein
MRGLAAWWPMWEGGGTKVYDISGNKNHGDILNSEVYPWVSGHSVFGGPAVRIDGADELIDVPSSTSLSPTIEISISLWFRLRSAATDFDGLIAKVTNDIWNDGYTIFFTNDFDAINSIAFVLNAFANHAYVAFDWTTDFNWHHVLARYRNPTMEIFLDGVKGVDDTLAAELDTNTATLQIGKNRDGATIYTSPIDMYDVRIWDRKLNDSELTELILNPWGLFKRRQFGPMAQVSAAPPPQLPPWHRRKVAVGKDRIRAAYA